MRSFKIPCGDWIYPSKDSLSSVRYPIKEPLVAEIFLPPHEAGRQIACASRISAHLCGPRFMECGLRDDQKALRIVGVKNENDQDFFIGVRVEIEFDPVAIKRVRSAPVHGREWDDHMLFTSVILQAHIDGSPLPSGIVFRKATIPEIEAVGRW